MVPVRVHQARAELLLCVELMENPPPSLNELAATQQIGQAPLIHRLLELIREQPLAFVSSGFLHTKNHARRPTSLKCEFVEGELWQSCDPATPPVVSELCLKEAA